MQKSELLEKINWTVVLAAPRYAGGHDEVMQSIFEGSAEVLNHYNEGDYQGTVATAFVFPDGGVVIITDYYGSCSGCDSWEDASNEEARAMVTGLVTSARVFDNVEDARAFCEGDKSAEDYPFYAAANLKF